MLKSTDYLTRLYDKPEGWSLAAYERDLGGYQVARRVLTTMTREQVVDEADHLVDLPVDDIARLLDDRIVGADLREDSKGVQNR